VSGYRIIQGDCIEVMRQAKAESIHAIVCDPPYGLEFMGKTWDSPAKMLGQATGVGGGFNHVPAGVHRPDMSKCDGELFGQWCEAWATEALRILKPGGHLLAFGGTRMYHWLAVGIERGGFEIRDSIAWHYSSGMPKAKKIAGHDGWKTACLKPAFEPIVVARKPFKGTVRSNMDEHGIAGFHIDACRVGEELMVNGPGMAGWNAYRHEGGYQATDEVEATVNEGRFPANVMLEDGAAEEMARYFFVAKPSAKERWKGLSKCTCPKRIATPPARATSPRVATGASDTRDAQHSSTESYGSTSTAPSPTDGTSIIETATSSTTGSPTSSASIASRTNDCTADASSETESGSSLAVRANPSSPSIESTGTSAASGFIRSAVDAASSAPSEISDGDGNRCADCGGTLRHHSTVKPIALMRELIRLVAPPGSQILDPFAGSGTTGIAALLEGMKFIGIEMDSEYADVARLRIEHWTKEEATA